MGRYDKIRYWNGSSWKQPSQIKAWNGSSWVDYGSNTSTNTNSIYAPLDGTWKRFTLNRKVETTVVDKYLQMSGGKGCDTNKLYQGDDFEFDCVMSFDKLQLQTLCEAYVNSNRYLRIGLGKDGNSYYVYASSHYSSTYNTFISHLYGDKIPIQANRKYHINVKIGHYSTDNGTMTGSVTDVETGVTQAFKTSSGNAAPSGVAWYMDGLCNSRLFGEYLSLGRPVYGKIYSCYIKGRGTTDTVNAATYDMMNAPTNGTTLVGTNLLGGGQASLTHYGTIVDVTETETTWV